MRLEIGTNFDDDLLEQIKDYHVAVIYGKMTEDFIGGGRPSFALPEVDAKRVQAHIQKAHQCGIKFNYLLNSVCMDNLELTAEVNQKIIEFLDMLVAWGVDGVTVSIPYLIELVRTHAPSLEVSVSAFTGIDSIQKAKHFESLGVSEITLPESHNRDFEFLKKLKAHIHIPIRLIATNDCLLSCPFQQYHPIYQSHASQSGHVSEGFAFDFCLLRCTYERLKDKTNFIKAGWIRPEDLSQYEAIGYDHFKLTERLKKTEKIVKMVKAYSERKYDGNLAEILNVRMSQEDFGVPNFKYIDKPEFADFGKMNRAFRLLFANRVYIDNQKLEGFIDFFLNKKTSCLKSDCDECGYCQRIADDAVVLQNEEADADLVSFEELFAELNSGKFFEEVEDKMEWTNEVKELLEKMVLMKPEFIQEVSRQTMISDAEEGARKRGASEVTVDDIVAANFRATPKEIHPMMITGLLELGINVDKYLDEEKQE